jgi:hypothetical protein
MLVRLLYTSRTVQPMSVAHIDSIMAQSRKNNPDRGITGILCHGGNSFLQVLEGGRGAVNEIYNKITQDDRHQQVVLLHYEEITERAFGNWTMGAVNLAKINPSLVLKYSETSALDPYTVSGKVSMALLGELIATAAIIGRG